MPQLKFLLGETQSACIVDYAGTSSGTVRKLFFLAEPTDRSSIEGKQCQLHNDLQITESSDSELSGSIDACEALDASGKPTVLQASIELRLPSAMFTQLLGTQERTIWLELKTSNFNVDSTKSGERTISGYNAQVLWARFSVMPLAAPKQASSSESVWLQRIFWALLAIWLALVFTHH